MLLSELGRRRVLFFGGKGGVGKTTLASATAAGLGAAGRRVLVVSTDPAHNLGHLWQRDVGPSPVRLAAGVDGVELDPASTVDEHLKAVERSLRKLMPERLHGEVRRHLEAAREAPGMVEAAMLEKIAITVEEGLSTHDVVIFDTAPTGHTTRLLELPELMAGWTQGLLDHRRRAQRFESALGQFRAAPADGPGAKVMGGEPDRDHEMRAVLLRRQQRFTALRAILMDREACAFVVVLAAERLPVLETIDLARKLETLQVALGGLVVNKRAPTSEGDFWSARVVEEEAHLRTLHDALGHHRRIDIAMSPREILGAEALEVFAARNLS
ncbi:ArsA family ATPase [Aureimonas mangrovi]|uniref:ArsA family ATPase n=1 Tax=Aureimonas mangrovi TaxID=2758041 RepID=UPI00163DCB95|nr:ArsA family ATPase [Aureimonas mangrovi]